MAKLCAHGEELVRLEFPNHRTAVMADGAVMRNYGDGWKLHGKVKDGVDVRAYAAKRKAKWDAMPEAGQEYCLAIAKAVPLELRGKLHTYVTLMPGDVDGVWSEMNMWQEIIDFEDCATLCRLWSQLDREVPPSGVLEVSNVR